MQIDSEVLAGPATVLQRVAAPGHVTYLRAMTPSRQNTEESKLQQEWALPAGATLGSSVRAKGIIFEMRVHLTPSQRKALDVSAGVLMFRMRESDAEVFAAAAAIISAALIGIESLPVIPREIEDILGIKTSERHRWLKDGRLPSAGTRTLNCVGEPGR